MMWGTVHVNGNTIARWSARNIGPRIEDGPVGYDCELEQWEGESGRRIRFEVLHYPDDGALQLAQRVMQEASALVST